MYAERMASTHTAHTGANKMFMKFMNVFPYTTMHNHNGWMHNEKQLCILFVVRDGGLFVWPQINVFFMHFLWRFLFFFIRSFMRWVWRQHTFHNLKNSLN